MVWMKGSEQLVQDQKATPSPRGAEEMMNRSAVSSSLLASRGYKNIANVLGGMGAWKLAGLSSTGK